MFCKGVCTRYQAKRQGKDGNHYSEGHKRCQVCQIFIKWDESLFCPCCGYRLRTKPRDKNVKQRYAEKMKSSHLV